MKKTLFVFLCFALLWILPHMVSASSDYQNYESITMSKGKLLSDFSDDDYDSYYKIVDKRKFFGWKVYQVNTKTKVTYVTETLFSYYNDGYTAIDYTYKLNREVASKVSLSSSGTISVKINGNSYGFKNNLETTIKVSTDVQTSSEDKESYEISLKVDPGTQVDLYVYGEGKITNGVAARYIFWIRADRGGYEVFTVTTQYQRLEKKRI